LSRTSSAGQQGPTTLSLDEIPPTAELDSGIVAKEFFQPPSVAEYDDDPASPPQLAELEAQERRVAEEEEAAVQRKREEALRIAAERGLTLHVLKDARPRTEDANTTQSRCTEVPSIEASSSAWNPSQLPTPIPIEDKDDDESQAPVGKNGDVTRDSSNIDDGRKGRDEFE
jgi:hypothetical protein